MTELLLLVGFFAVAFVLMRIVNKAGGLAGGC
jgi:hypothetical protein